MPKIVAQLMTANEVGWSFFDSTESCVVDAASSALLIWAAREGLRSLDQPVRRGRLDVELRMACSVITVFGADVPLGSAPISWMTGLARQSVAART